MAPKPYLELWMAPKHTAYGLEPWVASKPYGCKKFGATDGPKTLKMMGFGIMYGPQEFINSKRLEPCMVPLRISL